MRWALCARCGGRHISYFAQDKLCVQCRNRPPATPRITRSAQEWSDLYEDEAVRRFGTWRVLAYVIGEAWERARAAARLEDELERLR